MTKNLALELAPIRVNLIAAGFVDTPLSAKLLGDQLDARREQLRTALDSSDGEASLYRARARELLVRTGSLARVNTRFLRVLPRVRTPPTGRPSFSRYACVQGPGIEARWHKMPTHHRTALTVWP
jgi:NAD(P)-dependent dehydrogenase (short-subunit alcohol dehydrogenase family)